MDWTRSNIFDSFGSNELVYHELQPLQTETLPHSDEPYGAQQIPPQDVSPRDDDANGANQLEFDTTTYADDDWIPDDTVTNNPDNYNEQSDKSSDEEEYPEILQQSDPEPEDDSDDEEDEIIHDSIGLPVSSNVVLSKNKSIAWSKLPIPQVGRTPTRNVFKPSKSNVKHPQKIHSISSAFELIFTDKIVNEIVKMTNQEGRRQKGKRWNHVDVLEMKALIGLYIHLGARQLSLSSVSKIWFGPSADNVAICTMSMTRFIDLSTAIRFDDKETRSSRRDRDVFAPLRDLFDEVQRNLQREYTPSQNLTVDEQLVPWRGRCKFLQYLPSKPDKYGLKLFLLCDSKTFYPLQAIPYLGKHGERKKNLGREIVMELVAPYHKSGRNITCDNFFTDLELTDYLAKRGLSIVGTVRKNKAFLPTEFQTGKLNRFESRFLFTEERSLVAYKSNAKKHVVVLSTMHHSADVDDEGKKKPEIVKHYNKTKGGVDTFDFLCHSFSCKRKTRRWPMVLFFNLVDTAAVAAHILYKEVFPEDTDSHGDRGRFNEMIGKELIMDHMGRRMAKARTTPRVKMSFAIINVEWGLVERTATTKGIPSKRRAEKGRCTKCPRKKDKKIKQVCSKCEEFVCKEHSKTITVCAICE